MNAPIAFADLPDAVRMAFRYAVESYAGGEVDTYQGYDVTVYVGRGRFAELLRLAKMYGLTYKSAWYFPVCHRMADHLRHDGPNTPTAPNVTGNAYTLTAIFGVR